MCQATAICAQGTMLAEIFVLRLEAILRFSQEASASSRFVPLRALLHPKGKSAADGAVSTASSH